MISVVLVQLGESSLLPLATGTGHLVAEVEKGLRTLEQNNVTGQVTSTPPPRP